MRNCLTGEQITWKLTNIEAFKEHPMEARICYYFAKLSLFNLNRKIFKWVNGPLHIKSVPHQNLSKEARLNLVLYLINAGQVRLLREVKSLDLLLHQLHQFPNGKHDDLVDSFTQALRVLPTLRSGKAVWRIS